MSLLEHLLWGFAVAQAIIILLFTLDIVIERICYEIKEFIDYVFYDIEPSPQLGQIVDGPNLLERGDANEEENCPRRA